MRGIRDCMSNRSRVTLITAWILSCLRAQPGSAACFASQTNCITCNDFGNVCYACKPGYFLWAGTCSLCMRPCISGEFQYAICKNSKNRVCNPCTNAIPANGYYLAPIPSDILEFSDGCLW